MVIRPRHSTGVIAPLSSVQHAQAPRKILPPCFASPRMDAGARASPELPLLACGREKPAGRRNRGESYPPPAGKPPGGAHGAYPRAAALPSATLAPDALVHPSDEEEGPSSETAQEPPSADGIRSRGREASPPPAALHSTPMPITMPCHTPPCLPSSLPPGQIRAWPPAIAARLHAGEQYSSSHGAPPSHG